MRRITVGLLVAGALLGLVVLSTPAAFGDGDPASDVLAFRVVYNPPDSRATAQQYAELKALIRYLSRHRYPLRVALIATPADLGTATEYWEDAKGYAGDYLGKELSLIYHGNLLVVMPEHYGFYDPVPTKDIPAGDKRVMDGDLAAPGADLAGGTVNVVRKLAAANGIILPRRLAISTPRPQVTSISPRRRHHRRAVAAVIGWVAGLFAVVVAWTASLRARPLRRRAVA